MFTETKKYVKKIQSFFSTENVPKTGHTNARMIVNGLEARHTVVVFDGSCEFVYAIRFSHF